MGKADTGAFVLMPQGCRRAGWLSVMMLFWELRGFAIDDALFSLHYKIIIDAISLSRHITCLKKNTQKTNEAKL